MRWKEITVAAGLFLTFDAELCAQDEYVYRLTVSQCRHGSSARVLSGFRDRRHQGIVTALHGVAGCKSIVAVNGTNTRTYLLDKVRGIDVDRDIVLLSSAELAAEPPSGLELDAVVPSSGLKVIGFPHALLAPLTSSLSLHAPPQVPLNDLLPSGQTNRAVIQTRLSPNPRVQVLSIQGHLTLGHSGAPILNAANRVVGIANGGLERGAIEISWAIPYLQGSVAWKTPSDVEPEFQRIMMLDPRVLFAFAEESPQFPGVSCFERTLDFVRSATLADLMSTVDDPATYQYLLNSFQLVNFTASFHIYRDIKGDVSLVVPESWTLAPRNEETCTASAPAEGSIHPFSLEFQLLPIESASASAQIDRRVTEAQFDMFFSRHFAIDVVNSNPTARFDIDRGIIARRVSFFQSDRFCGPFGLPPQPAAAQRPNGFPEPFVQEDGTPACEGGVVYPDTWMRQIQGNWQDYVVGAGFGSYMGNDRAVLISQVRTSGIRLGKEIQECMWQFSRTELCKLAFSNQRRFAVAVVAATASAIGNSSVH